MINVYIQDQKEIELPANAIPGFAVIVTNRKGKQIDSMYCSRKDQAEHMAQEYYRDHSIKAVWNG